MKALGVELHSSENKEKCLVAECWNRTMKEKIFKYFTANNNKKYIDVLDDFFERYNNMRHSNTKMTPVEASNKENEVRVYRNLYQEFERRPIHAKFKTGDKVRIRKKKGLFEKGFTPNWTEEVFTVSKIQRTNPVTYKITDYNDEKFKGLSMSKSFRRHRKRFTELRRL